ncbi:hypothetical protein BZG36_02722, partial [Bifiguratus adelaidae]
FKEKVPTMTELDHIFMTRMAGCHAVVSLNGRFIGNPQLNSGETEKYLETIRPPPQDPESHAIHILKRNEFVYARQSMRVSLHWMMKTGHVHIFVKGSFEKVKDASNPRSIPKDYDQVAERLAKEGVYTLALAHRECGLIDISVA